MNSLDRDKLLLTIIRWLARIWGGLCAAFLIFMILGHVVNGDGSFWPSGIDGVAFVFFTTGVAVGLVTAMKWEGLGGSITIVSMVAWHIIMNAAHGAPDIKPFIDGLAAPGLLFLVVWLLSCWQRRRAADEG